MANGFAPYILQDIQSIAKTATPQNKLEMPGYLQMLLTSMSPGVILNDTGFGQKRSVQVKKKKRYTVAQTTQTPSCDVTNKDAYSEDSVSVANYRQIAIHIEDAILAQYEAAAVKGVSIAGAPLVQEFLTEIMLAANALLTGVDRDLITLAASTFGVNRRTGVNTAAPINISKDTNILSLTDGVTQILSDYKLNSMSGKPIVVGSGLFNNYMMQQIAKGTAQNGLDTRILSSGMDFYYDNNVADILSDNDIIVYERDAVQLVQYHQYKGFRKRNTGENIFDTINLPYQTMTANGGLAVAPLEIDVHFKFNACDEVFTVNGQADQVLQTGWNMILSTNFGLHTIPSDAYRSGDVLEGNRGSLLYDITNDCDNCEAAGY